MKVCYILCNYQSVGYISMLCIQFHWQFLIISSSFRLVNILLWKFDTSLKKRNENDKNTNFLMKNNKKMSHSVLWTCHTAPWCNMLQTLEMQRKYRWKEIVSGTHSVTALNIEAQFFPCLSLYDETFTSQ